MICAKDQENARAKIDSHLVSSGDLPWLPRDHLGNTLSRDEVCKAPSKGSSRLKADDTICMRLVFAEPTNLLSCKREIHDLELYRWGLEVAALLPLGGSRHPHRLHGALSLPTPFEVCQAWVKASP